MDVSDYVPLSVIPGGVLQKLGVRTSLGACPTNKSSTVFVPGGLLMIVMTTAIAVSNPGR